MAGIPGPENGISLSSGPDDRVLQHRGREKPRQIIIYYMPLILNGTESH